MDSDIYPNEVLLDPVYRFVGDARVWNSWRKTAGLIKHMTRRSLAARYRGSALGFLWSLANPIALMIVYTIVVRFIFRLKSPGVPLQVYLMTGILAWNFLSAASIQAAVSLISGASLVNKSAFPRIVLPVSAVLANAVNYLVALPLLMAFICLSGVKPTTSLILLPCAILLLIMMATGLGTILSVLMPHFMDLQHLIEVLFTMWFFLTPVVYDVSLVPESWRFLYQLNPMVGIIQFVQSAFLGKQIASGSLVVSIAASLGIFALGLWIFSRLASYCTEI